MKRPQVAFRVGVSGAVSFPSTELDRLRAQAAEALRKIHDEVLRCARCETARRVYDPAQSPLLRLISPLADGADRLVAEAAEHCGFQLEVPLPFAPSAYEATFARDRPERHAASIAEFYARLAAAGPRVLTLDGDRLDDIDRPRSYEAVGRLVVRNCDLLIAVWDDDKAARGRGGTTDTVQYALRAGVPVWWIHATKPVAPKLLQDIFDLPRLGIHEAPGPAAHTLLRDYIAKVILPPAPAGPEFEGVWERFVTCLRCLVGVQTDPLLAFRDETGEPNRKLWNAHRNLMHALRAQGGRRYARLADRRAGTAATELPPVAAASTGPPPGAPTRTDKPPASWPGRIVRLLSAPFRRNDTTQASSVAAGLSGIYQQRYRLSYLLVFACGAVALFSVVVGLAFHETDVPATFIELFMLAIILGLVVTNEVLRWHERYISYRMLGELLRMSPYQHRLGWCLPGTRVSNLAHGTRHNWVAWCFAATLRATPLAKGTFGKAELLSTQQDIMANLIAEQLCFHDRRRKECRGAAHILAGWGRGFFLLTLILVVIRGILLLAHAGHTWVPSLSLACALLPAAAAAFFGIRAYEEFEVVAEQSEQMHEALSRAQTRIGRIEIDRPLASQVLGAELFDLTATMLSDVAGWAQLFRMKAVEA